jgi:hypothetical protein
MNISVVNRLIILFRNIHALVKMRHPFTDFEWMLELNEQNGLDIGNTYRNDKQAQIFPKICHYLSRYIQSLVIHLNNPKRCV